MSVILRMADSLRDFLTSAVCNLTMKFEAYYLGRALSIGTPDAD
jgi:hypothetical protein